MRTLRSIVPICLLAACVSAFYTYTLKFGVNQTMTLEVDVGSFDANGEPTNNCWFTHENELVNVMAGFVVEYDPNVDWDLFVECGTGSTIVIDESTDAYGVEVDLPNCRDVTHTCYLVSYRDDGSVTGFDTGGTDTGGDDTAVE